MIKGTVALIRAEPLLSAERSAATRRTATKVFVIATSGIDRITD